MILYDLEKELRTRLSTEFNWLEKDLNKWVIKKEPIGNDPEKDDYKRIELYSISLQNNIQKCPMNVDAFFLDPPSIGQIKNKIYDREGPLLCRSLIGYAFAKQLLENPSLLKPVLYRMIELIRREKGYNENIITGGQCFATFNEPGSTEFNIHLMENSAAFEIRCYSDCSKLEIV